MEGVAGNSAYPAQPGLETLLVQMLLASTSSASDTKAAKKRRENRAVSWPEAYVNRTFCKFRTQCPSTYRYGGRLLVHTLNMSTRHGPICVWVVCRRLVLTLCRIGGGRRRLMVWVGMLRPLRVRRGKLRAELRGLRRIRSSCYKYVNCALLVLLSI